MDGRAEARADLLEKVVGYGSTRLAEPTNSLFARFAPQYYAHLAPEDASARSVADLYGAALAHLHLAQQRAPGTPAVRI
jgi:glutamate dehydrogenase